MFNCLRPSVAGLSPRMTGFDPRSVGVGFVVGEVTLRKIFLQVLWFSPHQNHSTNAPYSSSSRCCSYLKDKRANPENLTKRKILSIMGKQWIENSEINPTRCNNCVYSSQWLYSTCFGWQFHPSSVVHMLYMASGRQVYCKLTKSVITIIFDTTANMQSQVLSY